MIGFVLGGGGNLGALQVGALQVLLERGIRPDLLVGSSVGAINAAYLAEDPAPDAPHRLADAWLAVRREDIYPGGLPGAVWRLLRRGESLYPAAKVRGFLSTYLPRPTARFRDVPLPLYVAATDLRRSRPHVFGDNADERVLDAVLASVTIPPYLPPVRHGDALLIDGGVAANLPIDVAVDRGATEIYALDVRDGALSDSSLSGTWTVTQRAIALLLEQQAEREYLRWAAVPGLRLHRFLLRAPRHHAFDDFGHEADLIATGRRWAEQYLDSSLGERWPWPTGASAR